MRVVVALGGNALTGPDGSTAPADERAAVAVAVRGIADVVAAGHDVVLTHGNGPQVGNALVRSELAAEIVPTQPLDWCVADTQASIGLLLLDGLDAALAERGCAVRTAVLVTRVVVDGSDPGFDTPTKPIGRYADEGEARRLMALGQQWEPRGTRGWRRVVASPEPLEILDAPAIRGLTGAGFLVVCAGGGGVPVVRDPGAPPGVVRGVEAVIDKDLSGALLARTVAADVFVIATDVEHAVLNYEQPDAEPIGQVDPATMRAYAAAGHFASGSMGPKVEAALRFVEAGGTRSVITNLAGISRGVAGDQGTVITAAVAATGAGAGTRDGGRSDEGGHTA